MAEYSRIDSHKMMFHPEWVSRWKEARCNWKKAKKLYPIYVEITPAEACNHRCTFCALDYVGHRPFFLKADIFKNALIDMANGGVKAVMYAGEGEPCLHPRLTEIINFTKKVGIDVSLTTNGSLMDRKFLEESMKDITWIKISIDAGTKDTYLQIHRPKRESDWENVFLNLEAAVALKRMKGCSCWIGVQALLLPESRLADGAVVAGNIDEIIGLAEKLKAIGVDAFVVKPYSHQPLSLTTFYKNVVYGRYWWLKKKLKKIESKNFEIIFRSHAMEKYIEERCYNLCAAVPFAWAHTMADGSVYSCSVYLLDKRFYLGNINEQSFKEIWEGKRRKRHWELMKSFNPSGCRKNCRMDEVNRYLWEVSRPPYNANFI